MCPENLIPNKDSASWTWCLLHEAGHAQKPDASFTVRKNISHTAFMSALFASNIWVYNKTVSKTSNLVKHPKSIAILLSFVFLSDCASKIFFSEMSKAEERRADAFANANANKEALLGGIQSFELNKKKISEATECINSWELDCPH